MRGPELALALPLAAERVAVLRDTGKSAVYRLEGAGPDGTPLVAKRCRAETGRIERVVYEQLLPQLPMRTLAYHGSVDAGESAWLFLEYGDGAPFDSELLSHRVLLARWLAALHGAASRCGPPAGLPARGAAHYLARLRSACATMRASLANERLRAEDCDLIARVVRRCHYLETRWARAEESCAAVPATLVHGDLQAKNLRIQGTGRRLDLVVMDWETAGWGAPAADVAASPAQGVRLVDPRTYRAAIRTWWPGLRTIAIERLADVGRVFGLVAALEWDVAGLATAWPQRALARLRLYDPELDDVTRGATWSR